jgi:hypothetical protein
LNYTELQARVDLLTSCPNGGTEDKVTLIESHLLPRELAENATLGMKLAEIRYLTENAKASILWGHTFFRGGNPNYCPGYGIVVIQRTQAGWKDDVLLNLTGHKVTKTGSETSLEVGEANPPLLLPFGAYHEM